MEERSSEDSERSFHSKKILASSKVTTLPVTVFPLLLHPQGKHWCDDVVLRVEARLALEGRLGSVEFSHFLSSVALDDFVDEDRERIERFLSC